MPRSMIFAILLSPITSSMVFHSYCFQKSLATSVFQQLKDTWNTLKNEPKIPQPSANFNISMPGEVPQPLDRRTSLQGRIPDQFLVQMLPSGFQIDYFNTFGGTLL